MTDFQLKNQITVRGGQVNIPNPTVHHLPSRHQPNTPIRKPKGQSKPVHGQPRKKKTKPPVPQNSVPETPIKE